MKGVMYELLVGMIGLAFIAFLFVALNEAYDVAYPYGATKIRINSTNTVDSTVKNNLDLVNTSFKWFPIVALFLFVVYLFVTAQRRSFQ